uniref:Saposin B-type domain-containing protein n=1 Tax=Panagrolaimus sp. JU765 TaxID=591449 RepID=A0AC34RNL8_9BILA
MKTLIVFVAFIAITAALVYPPRFKCALCHDFVKEVEKELALDADYFHTHDAHKLCLKFEELRYPFNTVCKHFSPKEIDEIFEEFRKPTPSKEICKKVKLC